MKSKYPLAHIKSENSPMHPDDCGIYTGDDMDIYNDWRITQLKAYTESAHGDNVEDYEE